jgi:hypothetical protein
VPVIVTGPEEARRVIVEALRAAAYMAIREV